MIGFAVISALVVVVVVLLCVVVYLRAQRLLDTLELAMLKKKVDELDRHPLVRPRPRPEIVKHLGLVQSPPVISEEDALMLKEAAQHAAAQERHEK